MKNKLKFRLRSYIFWKNWTYCDWKGWFDRPPSDSSSSPRPTMTFDMTKLMNIFGFYDWTSLNGTKIAWSIFKNKLSEGTFVIQIDPSKDFSCNMCYYVFFKNTNMVINKNINTLPKKWKNKLNKFLKEHTTTRR